VTTSNAGSASAEVTTCDVRSASVEVAACDAGSASGRRLVAAMSSDYAWRSDVGLEASYGSITCQRKWLFYLQKHASDSTFPGSLLSKRQLGDS
jgi:hypothetical protein